MQYFTVAYVYKRVMASLGYLLIVTSFIAVFCWGVLSLCSAGVRNLNCCVKNYIAIQILLHVCAASLQNVWPTRPRQSSKHESNFATLLTSTHCFRLSVQFRLQLMPTRPTKPGRQLSYTLVYLSHLHILLEVI